MENSKLKTSGTSIVQTVDVNTGEVLDISVNKTTYVCDKADKFWLMYSSMVMILKGSTDVRIKLFASLIERYGQGQEFAMGRSMKDLIAEETNCSSRSLDLAFTTLIKDSILIKLKPGLYKINPRHIFQGSSSLRNQSLKAVIELQYTTPDTDC